MPKAFRRLLLAAALAAPAAAGDLEFPIGASWQPGPGAPGARPAARGAEAGTVFSAPFGRRAEDRFYWDLAAPLDLDPYRVLELDLTVERPEAMRALTVYLESGSGWYAWSRTPARAGRQRLRLARADFTTEGAPGAWDAVTRVRLSLWRGAAADATVTVHGLRARTTPVIVLRGTRSLPDAAERRAAEGAVRRVTAALDGAGVLHAVLAEEDLAGGIPAGARTLVLPYNPRLPDEAWSRVRAFHRGGGRLVVFYSADARLAGALGLRLGDYTRAEAAGRWSAFRFVDPDGWQVPARVLQESGNIRPAWPEAPGTEVLAWWEDASGRRAEEPAWTAGHRGVWMSHVLLGGDGEGKAWMLAGLLTRLDPALWPDVAAAALDRSRRLAGFEDAGAATAAMRSAARGHPEARRVRALLDAAAALEADLEARRARGATASFLTDAARVRAMRTEAHARVQRPRAPEFRGVWDHGGAGWFPGDWDRSARWLAGHGMTAILPNLLWAGRAHYPSEVLPGTETLRRHGDQAAQVMAAARAHGLEAHFWVVCWNLGNAPPAFVAARRAEGRLQRDADGRELPWLCPAHPANVAELAAALREAARRYRPDGVHLDYIRFPSRSACTCPSCRAAFERRRRGAVADWPAPVREGGALRAQFEAWRAEVITGVVRRLRGELRAIDPSIQLSAAVFGEIDDARRGLGQDWVEWLREGLIDFAVPMNYTENPGRFAALTARQMERTRGLPGRVYPGIGVSANEAELAPDGVIEQVVRTRTLGAEGFVLFALNPELRVHTLPALRLGVAAPAPEETRGRSGRRRRAGSDR